MGHYTSIVPRPDGGALIAYRDAAIGVRVARVTANGGVTLISATSAGVSPSHPDGAGWHPRTTLAQVGEATGCSLAMDADGAAHVTFQDAGPGALQYVRDCP